MCKTKRNLPDMLLIYSVVGRLPFVVSPRARVENYIVGSTAHG